MVDDEVLDGVLSGPVTAQSISGAATFCTPDARSASFAFVQINGRMLLHPDRPPIPLRHRWRLRSRKPEARQKELKQPPIRAADFDKLPGYYHAS
jgi:hypothetical protein